MKKALAISLKTKKSKPKSKQPNFINNMNNLWQVCHHRIKKSGNSYKIKNRLIRFSKKRSID